MAYGDKPRVWAGSLDRVLGVTLGCVAALMVGFAFDFVSRLFSRRSANKVEAEGAE